jgi:hypothetical protein
MGGFTNASLKGTYAFSMSGEGATINDFGLPISRIGSFVADGNGNITAALEDLTDAGNSTGAIGFSGGTYSIQANGKGTLTLNSSATSGLQLNIVMTSASSGFLIQTDLLATSSGTFSLQSPGSFTQTAINGGYVFSVNGIDANLAPVSVVGQISTSGGGSVTSGVLDENDGSSPAPSGAVAVAPGGSYQLDATAGHGTTFGRGTISFGGLAFAFYIVDGTHIFLMEEDGVFATNGDAFQQSGTIATTNAGFTGNFVHVIGSGSLATGGPIGRGARYTADGQGNLTSIGADDNNAGLFSCIGAGDSRCTLQAAPSTYAIDTANAPTGRGTLKIAVTGQANPFQGVFYLISPTKAVIQDTSANAIGSGMLMAQSGTFSNSSLAGNYTFNLSGIVLGTTSQTSFFEEDFIGQYALSSAAASNVTGAADFVELGSSTSRPPAFLNVPITGTLKINGDGTQRNGFNIITGNSPSTTLNFTAYIASPQEIFLVGTDNTRVTNGTMTQQTQ